MLPRCIRTLPARSRHARHVLDPARVVPLITLAAPFSPLLSAGKPAVDQMSAMLCYES